MSEKRPQTFANHGRFDPLYHFVLAPASVICFGFSIGFLVHKVNSLHIWLAVVALLLVLLVAVLRRYALKVQDRVIRLEERLRLTALLPAVMHPRIHELTERQLIAMRFAADDEIPSLVEKTLREGLDPKGIKKAIDKWRPDYWRV